jgi:hypothetical protein
MAHMTGLNATEVALWALIESETNPTRQEQLYEALGKGLARAGAVASLAMFSSAASASEVMRYFIRCIDWLSPRAPFGLHRTYYTRTLGKDCGFRH